jgi:hypothetical protein
MGGFGNPLKTSRVDITTSMIDQKSHTVYQDSVIDHQSDFKPQVGILADVGDLRASSEIVLNRTVDRMLDSPDFRAAVAGSI